MSDTVGEHAILKDTGVAQADYSAKQYFLVYFNAEDQITLCGAGAAGYVLLDAPASGASGTVALAGKVPCTAGAAVSIGAKITPDAAGKGVTATSSDVICGIAITAAAADGDLFEMLVVPPVAILA